MLIIHYKGYNYKLSRIKLTAAISPVCACRSAPWNWYTNRLDPKKIKTSERIDLIFYQMAYCGFNNGEAQELGFCMIFISKHGNNYLKIVFLFIWVSIKTQTFYHVKKGVC